MTDKPIGIERGLALKLDCERFIVAAMVTDLTGSIQKEFERRTVAVWVLFARKRSFCGWSLVDFTSRARACVPDSDASGYIVHL